MDDARLERLIADYYTGALNDADRVELETRLREDSRARQRFVESAFDELAMVEALGRSIPAVPSSPPGSTRRWGRWAILTAAVATVIAALAWWLLRDGTVSRPEWAHLERGRCAVVEDEGELRDVEQVRAGIPHLSRSELRLELAGTRVRLKPDSAFVLAAPTEERGNRPQFELLSGEARFEVPDGAPGVLVRTPAGDLIDRGTEFQVIVRREETSMRRHSSLAAVVLATVFSGIVEFTPARGGSTQELRPEQGPLELRDDGRIGKVVDREGIGQVRSANAGRWTLAADERPLDPGDWLQTGARGAHALAVRLSNGTKLTLGPGAQLQIEDAGRARLARGELEIVCPESASLELVGPGDQTVTVGGTQLWAVREGQLRRLSEPPRWLIGYRSDQTTDALGSLLANIDGRNVPLSIGYHKVTVDIRDQIARTTIEESFVNHTGAVLEGVFYFPLPADASISGFAMWIDGERVDADIVEKQRAREIYETILREKRDPGLLEWSGGNVFKARIYPIRGEKRIQIRYTQVLPKDGDTYRYQYGLQSELTRSHPLERLEIEVTISSAEPIAEVTCPSHPARVSVQPDGARVELSQREVVPERDFEITVRTEPTESAARVIPHRRTSEGYFLMTIDAPSGREDDSSARRQAPIELLILADTSGSLAGPAREEQIAFVEALLASLGEQDRFNLATTDVAVSWAFDQARVATAENRRAALELLAERRPLGWTDLEAAFESAFARSGKDTHIVYAGDGVLTKGDLDGAAFVQRLKTIPRESSAPVHSVAVSSSYDALVLRGLARIGSGSWRHTDEDPARAAAGLLEELTKPSLRDLELEFEGVEVAAVYPESLPNLTAGAQQIVVGRFDPSLGEVVGRVKVQGRLGDEEVRFEAPFDLRGADQGNSFIPRLWARHHLDHLLEQGDAAENRERIITLSTEFQIMTPYTSFLVLESEEDRRRFQVERQFRMRDGEEFFAEGRQSADFALRRAQQQIAERWRFETRRRVIEELSELGRDWMALLSHDLGDGVAIALGERGRAAKFGARRVEDRRQLGWQAPFEYALDFDVELRDDQEVWAGTEAQDFDDLADSRFQPAEPDFEAGGRRNFRGPSDSVSPSRPGGPATPGPMRQLRVAGKKLAGSTDWYQRIPKGSLPALFPAIGDATWPVELPDSWNDDVRDILRGLDRTSWLNELDGGLRLSELSVPVEDEEPASEATRGQALVSDSGWWTISASTVGEDARIDWLHEDDRGAMSESWRFARVRPRLEGDALAWRSPIPWLFGQIARSVVDEETGTSVWTLRLERLDDRLRLVLESRLDDDVRREIDLTLEGDIVLAERHYRDGELTSRVEVDELFEAAGRRWPGRLRRYDAEGDLIAEQRFEVEWLEGSAFIAALESELERLDDAIVLGPEAPTPLAAREAIALDEATVTDALIALFDLVEEQRFELAEPAIGALRELTAGRRGAKRLMATIERLRRRHEVVESVALELARDLSAEARSADLAAAEELLGFTAAVLEASERWTLLEALEPVFARQPGSQADLRFERHRLRLLDELGRSERALALARDLAVRFPGELSVHLDLAGRLQQRSEVEAALNTIAVAESELGPWTEDERARLRWARVDALESADRYDEAVSEIESIVRELPGQVVSWRLDDYLTRLTMLDRLGRVDSLIRQWIERVLDDAELSDLDRYRLEAALNHALGGGRGLNRSGFDEQFAPSISRAVLETLWTERGPLVFGQVLGNWALRRSAPGLELVSGVYDEVAQGIDSRDPRRLGLILFQLQNGGGYEPEAGQPDWADLYVALLGRWGEAGLGGRMAIENILARHASPEMKKTLWRRVASGAETRARRALAWRSLFDLLLEGSWSEAIERELFELLPNLVVWREDAPEALRERALAAEIRAIARLVAWLPGARVKALIEANPESPSWTRRQLADEARRLGVEAREALRARLGELELSIEPVELRGWVALERWGLSAAAPEEPERTSREALDLAREVWARFEPEGVGARAQRERVLLERALATATFFAAVAGQESAASGDLVDYLEEKTDPRALIEGHPSARLWLFRLLMAQGVNEALRERLVAWAGEDTGFATLLWARLLAPLLVEAGEVDEAIARLERVEERDRLDAEDYRLLAGWRLLKGDRAGEREAWLQAYGALDDWTLRRQLQSELPRYRRSGSGVPEEIDASVLLRFEVMFAKAPNPQQHVWLLREYYEATKDFRLLAVLPRAVRGFSAQRIYPLLEQLQQRVLELLHDEATLDRLLDEIDALLARDPRPVDRRALHLLELLLAWRGTQQASGTEGFADRFEAALELAWQDEWAAGERVAMADFLASLGAVEAGGFSAARLLEAVGQLRVGCELGTVERVQVAKAQSRIAWKYGRREEAVRSATSAIDAYRSVHEGELPASLRDVLHQTETYLRELGRFAAAEELWLTELERATHELARRFAREQLFEVYPLALRGGGSTSLGSGEDLYVAARDAIWQALDERTGEDHAAALVSRWCELFAEAVQKLEAKQPREDMLDFAFRRLPRVLGLYQHRGAREPVRAVAQVIENHVSPIEALRFLVTRAETEPSWLERRNLDFWSRESYRFAKLCVTAEPSGDLERRALAIMIEALQETLAAQGRRSQVGYHDDRSYFWSKHREDFQRVALEVAERLADSEPHLLFVADYLWDGLSERGAAIDLLVQTHERRGLSLTGRRRLTRYLVETERWSEALPLAAELVEEKPDEIELRSWWLLAIFHTEGQAAARQALEQSEEHFREKEGLWSEQACAVLAARALDLGLWQKAVELYDEAINLHTRGRGDRGSGNGQLAPYYRSLAAAYAALGKTREAVDAAAGAILTWGPSRKERALELERLQQVLAGAEDLDAFLGSLDAEVAETGLENPIVRKAAGEVYLERRVYSEAIVQLERAFAVVPEDEELARRLVSAYDLAGQQARAAERLWEMASGSRSQYRLFMDLGDRWVKLERPEDAERAYTNVVELLPNESESHELLAKKREVQERYEAAEHHWREVTRIRSEEPAGYLGVARNLIAQGEGEEAKPILERLLREDWPARFGEVHQQARELMKKVE